MRIILLAIIIAFFSNYLYSQINYETKLDFLKQAIKELNYPNIDLSLDTFKYNNNDRLIEQWNKYNREYAENMGIFTFKDYLNVIEKDYSQKPKFVNTGNPKQDEQNYKLRLNKWVENHPDYPQYLDTGNPSVDKEKLRKARLRFYNKYIKED